MASVGARQAVGAALAAWAALGVLWVAGASAAAPPAATARCGDGSYSSSLHRSGTCSHHGGVRTWLDGSAGARLGSAPVGLGSTVLLRPRGRASECRLGPKPDRRCSPGAFYRGLTKDVICSATFRTSAIRHVPTTERHAVEVEYGLRPRRYGSTLEIDHIVSLELGGSNDIANLFPERRPPVPATT